MKIAWFSSLYVAFYLILFCSIPATAQHFEHAKRTGILFPIKNYAVNKYGFIDSNGKVIIDFQYDFADQFENGVATVRLPMGENYLIDLKGNKISDNDNGLYYDGFRKITSGGKYGFVNDKGIVAVKPAYDEVDNFIAGVAPVKLNNKWGFINAHGLVIIPVIYDEVYPFCNGLSSVKLNGKWGNVDQNGKYAINPKYDAIGNYSESLVAVSINKKWGYANNKGALQIACQYEEAGRFVNGLSAVMLKSKWGYINNQNAIKIQCKFEDADRFSEDLAGVMVNSKWGFINKSGSIVIEAKYDKIVERFQNGTAMVKLNDKNIIINKQGEVLCDDCYSLDYAYGIARVSKTDQYGRRLFGFVNQNGKLFIPHRYKNATDFYKNIAAVTLADNDVIYIDSLGNNIFNKHFLYGGPFSSDAALIKKEDGEYTYINRNGVQWPNSYGHATSFYEGYAVVGTDDYNILIDASGKKLCGSKAHFTGSCINGMAAVYYTVGGDGNARVDMNTGQTLGDPGESYSGYANIKGKGNVIFFLK